MNRLYMKARTFVLSTKLGKSFRKKRIMRLYKFDTALATAKSAYPDKTEKELSEIAEDMMREAKNFNVGFEEYVMYHFENRSEEDRRLFIPTRERALYCEKLNDPKNQMIFDDKGKTYEVFGKYFKRDLVEVVGWSASAMKAFQSFVQIHPRFIIKPFNGGNGRGIKIVDCTGKDFKELCATLKNEYANGFVAEELIRQCAELAAVHPESVNTMRIFTVRFDDRIEFLPFAWRVGRGSACVDNGGSGGIFCALNEEGEIISTADEKGRFYSVHPDTGHPLIGFKIPRFEEAKELAKELAMVVPDNRYCGWDIALTDDGWVMQEGNWQGGIVAFQCPLQRGYRKEMDAILKELKIAPPKNAFL